MVRGYLTGMALYLLLFSVVYWATRGQITTPVGVPPATQPGVHHSTQAAPGSAPKPPPALATYLLAGHKIGIEIVPEKSRFMLGEPIRVKVVVHNLSSQSIDLDIGADPLSSFDRTGIRLQARRDDGMLVLSPPARPGCCSIMKGIKPTRPGTSDSVDLFLPHILTFHQPGTYTLECQTELIDLSAGQDAYQSRITVGTHTTLTILPTDSQAMGQMIDRLGHLATIPLPPHAAPSQVADRAIEALGAIQDPRVLPWVIRMFETHDFNRKYKALDILTLIDSQVAFETLQAGLAIRKTDLDDSLGAKEATDTISYLRAHAAYCLAKSAYPASLAAVQSLLNDPDAEVRRQIGYALEEENSHAPLSMLRTLANDSDKEIRKSARWAIECRTDPHKFP